MRKVGLIPARLESSRLPRKALLDIAGYPMIVHVAKRAKLSKQLDMVAVCTDCKEIAEVCIASDIDVVLTKSSHKNGTERIAEAANFLDLREDDVIVDIQGDEPLLLPAMVDNVAERTFSGSYDVIVPYIKMSEGENANRVKVIESNGRIIYLTRADAPHGFLKASSLKKHLSIIGFKRPALERFYQSSQTPLELTEGVELLRALELGMTLGTFEEFGETLAVDTQGDLERVIRLMQRDALYGTY